MQPGNCGTNARYPSVEELCGRNIAASKDLVGVVFITKFLETDRHKKIEGSFVDSYEY